MATPSDISVGLAHEFIITATKVGWKPKDFADLAHNDRKLSQILPFIHDFAEITPTQNVIDCDIKPFGLLGEWEIKEHKKGGQLILDLSKVKLHFSPNQVDGKVIEGNKLYGELMSESVLNANVLDYLIAFPKLIPEDWKRDVNGKRHFILFWGTIYSRSFLKSIHSKSSHLFVRSLSWEVDGWYGGVFHLDGEFGSLNPAAVLVS